MIGHYLLALKLEAEDRVLGEKLACSPMYVREDGCRCLVGVAANVGRGQDQYDRPTFVRGVWKSRIHVDTNVQIVGWHFDYLCNRFGEARINAAIRNRILSNRAYRILGSVAVETA